MNCPDLATLSRAGAPHADPAVAEHLRTCDSCRLDWQIQQGTRYLLDPEIETGASASLDERIIARATAIARQSEQRPGWGHLAGSGLLAALAAVAVTWALNEGAAVPYARLGLYGLVVAVATVLYLRRKDGVEFSGAHDPLEDELLDGVDPDSPRRAR